MSREGPARPSGADLRRHHPWVVHTQGPPCWSGVTRVREGWLGPHFLRAEPVIVEELTAALSVEWAWEHTSQSPHEEGREGQGGGGKKQLWWENVYRVSLKPRRRMGCGGREPRANRIVLVTNHQRSNTRKSRGHWVWLVRAV